MDSEQSTQSKGDSSTQGKGANQLVGVSAFGAVAAAALSSACCWTPIALLAFGASAAGASAFFERWRPFFATLSLVMLGMGFYFSYFRSGSCDGDSQCAARRRRRLRLRRAMLWVSAVIVIGFVSFPRYAGVLMHALGDGAEVTQTAATDAQTRTLLFDVQGMTCRSCAASLQSDLASIDGVLKAKVKYGAKSARVQATDAVTVERIKEAAKLHGFKASLVMDQSSRVVSEATIPGTGGHLHE